MKPKQRLRCTIDARLYRRLEEHCARTQTSRSDVLEALLTAYFRPDWEELEQLYAEDRAMLNELRRAKLKMQAV